MWYPSQQQQQQYSCYGYTRHHPSQQQQQQQQQQTYSRTSYYCNTDELSTTCVGGAINDENESPNHCQTTYSGSAHATTPNYYVTTSLNPYGDEMSSYQTIPARKTVWNPVIVAPTRNANMITPPVPVASPPSSAPITTCWDWVLFSPQYHPESYTPASTCVQQPLSNEEEEEAAAEDEDEHRGLNWLASLPTCLLALLYLTPDLTRASDDENESDQELGSLHSADGSSLPISQLETKSNTLSSAKSSNPNSNRSSTPDTDDGYQSASDASRSDYSQLLSLPYNHHLHRSKEDICSHERSLPTPLMPRRISYAAAAKPATAAKVASLPVAPGKSKQTINKTLSSISTTNDLANTNGQKLKFIAPRFERMHHAKQHSSPATSTVKTSSSSASNRTQLRSTNNNQQQQQQQPPSQRHYPINSTRRR